MDFKAAQRAMWADFAANEGATTMAAGELVAFARVKAGETVLDVACGTGVVAITAARQGALVRGLDLTPELLERARMNAELARVAVEFTLGDAEALSYPDASFDVVLSQFGHIFAPRPEVVTAEMLRILKPGGRIAFTTWPPEHMPGVLFLLVGRNSLQIEGGAGPMDWGIPETVRERLADGVRGLRFGRGVMTGPALSVGHVLKGMEATFSPVKPLLARLDREDPARGMAVREEMLGLIGEYVEGNVLRFLYLMTVAVKV